MKPGISPNIVSALLAALIFFPTFAPGQARLKQVAENQTFAGTLGESSLYVEARGFAGPGRPLVFGGNFKGAVNFPLPFPNFWSGSISGPAGIDSIFYGEFRETSPGGGWHSGIAGSNFDRLVPFSGVGITPSCEMRDMAIVSEDESYVAGVVTNTGWFTNNAGIVFSVAPNFQVVTGRGFIATAADGDFAALTLTNLNLRPRAIAAENGAAHVVIFGQQRDGGDPGFEEMDALLHRYEIPDTSTLVDVIPWNTESKFANMDAKDVEVTTADKIWVAGSVAGSALPEDNPPTGDPLGGTTDLWIGRADFPNTQVVDDFLLGSEGFDEWGGMKAGPNGEIYVAFKVGGSTVSFGGLSLTIPSFPVSHSCLGMIRSDGTPAWVTLLARGNEFRSAMLATDLDIDSSGNVYVSITANGNFEVRNTRYTMNGTGQIVVDGTGRVVSFTPTPNVVTARASVVYDLENRFVLGRSSPPFVAGKASFSSIQSQGITQESYTASWTIPTSSDNTVNGLDRQITELGGQVYLTSNYHFPPQIPIKHVSAYLTPGQFATLDQNPLILMKLDPLAITPDQGEGDPVAFESVSNAGWALARLMDPFSLATGAEAQFHYPAGFVTATSTARKVRVYVIDKGLAPGQAFDFPDFSQPGAVPSSFDGDNGLCVDALAHQTDNGQLDPATASAHPVQAVNLVGVASLGSGQGTAMEFISVDMYTGSSTDPGNCLTYLSFVSHAISQVIEDRNIRLTTTGINVPSLIVIASSGPTPITELDIGGAVSQAIASGIPVILSAGNAGGDVADFVPARLGALEGVITVGGLAEGDAQNRNPKWSGSNTDSTGNIISLWAPGEGVPTGVGVSSGTSYSCALVAGIAATYLSMNPAATPAEVEQALIDFSYRDEDRGPNEPAINIARTTCSFAAWLFQNGLGDLVNNSDRGMTIDSDGDGLSNLGEFLGRSDPNDPTDKGSIPTRFSVESNQATITALLPRGVVGANGHFGDGCGAIPLGFEVSNDLENWIRFGASNQDVRTGGLRGNLRELSLELELASPPAPRAFLRLVFGPPPP